MARITGCTLQPAISANWWSEGRRAPSCKPCSRLGREPGADDRQVLAILHRFLDRDGDAVVRHRLQEIGERLQTHEPGPRAVLPVGHGRVDDEAAASRPGVLFEHEPLVALQLLTV